MKILSIQEAYKSKFKRQKAIKNLEYHASGHCVHIGKLSPGCYGCFSPGKLRVTLLSGVKCNLDCPYCFSKLEREFDKNEQFSEMAEMVSILGDRKNPNYGPKLIAFSGGGEPLLYLDKISRYMKLFTAVEKNAKKKSWYFLYTNGVLADMDALLRLKDLGFDEIRFHLGASNFSKAVYKNLKKAVGYFKTISVETVSWPPHRKKLFEMLPIINDIGVKHLNMAEAEITKHNYGKIAKIFPNGEIYQCYEMHLHDGGLIYDIMEEALKKKYSYSVLDCNCFVKEMQRSPAKRVAHEDVQGLCQAR